MADVGKNKPKDTISNVWDIWDVDNLKNLEINKKNFSWNGISTKNFSDLLIKPKKRGHTNYQRYYEEVVNSLGDSLALNLQKKVEYKGRSAINTVLWNKFVLQENLPNVAVKYLDKKMTLDPFTFLAVFEVVKSFVGKCSQKSGIKQHLLKRTDLAAKQLVMEMLSQLGDSVKRYYLINFYNYVSPFDKIENQVKKAKRQPFFHPVVENHCEYKLKKGTSESSIVNYRSQIRRFFEWCCNTLKEFQEYSPNTINVYMFKKEHLTEYKLFLEAEIRRENCTPNGARTHFIYVKEFFLYVYQLGFLKDDITKDLTNIEAKEFVYRQIPSNKQLQMFFNAVSMYSEAPLIEKTAYSLMLFLGLRLNEVANLKWRDINIGNKTISIKGKNKQSEILPIPELVLPLLKNLKRSKQGYVFSKKPNQFKSKLYQNFKLYKLISDMEVEGGVHLLRHIYITKLSYMCTPNTLRVLARHKSDRSISFYLHFSDDELTDAINKIFGKGL